MSQANLPGFDRVGSWTVPDLMEGSGTSFSKVNLNAPYVDSPVPLSVAANLPGSAQAVEEKSDDVKKRNPKKAAKLPALECLVRTEEEHDVAGQEHGASGVANVQSAKGTPQIALSQNRSSPRSTGASPKETSPKESQLKLQTVASPKRAQSKELSTKAEHHDAASPAVISPSVRQRASISSVESLGIAKSSEALRSDFLGRLELELAQAAVPTEVGGTDGFLADSRVESQTIAKSRWKAAAKVVAPEKKVIMTRQQSIAILAGNLSKKTGKHVLKNILGKLSMQQVERMLAYNEMEKLTGKIVAEFDKVKDRQKSKGFENLFLSIDKDGGGTVNVAGELGETLIRLGISVEVQAMHEAINKVCSARGRQPDEYYGTGVSIRIPIFNELEVDEFVEVMFLLTKMKENNTERVIKSRELFAAIDKDNDGKIDLAEFCAMLDGVHVEYDLEKLQPMFDRVVYNPEQPDDVEMDFKTFLELQGIEGTNEDYVTAELESRRQRLKEAMTTFMTFDVDGGGSIDIVKIGAVMRAMGRKVTEDELESMMSVADVAGRGEIDFEQFCEHILNIRQDTFYSLIEAHKIQPVFVEQIAAVHKKILSVEDLAPVAWKKSQLTYEERLALDLETRHRQESGQPENYVWEDFGQHGIQPPKHPLLDPTQENYSSQFARAAVARPFALTAQKDSGTITMARFFPEGTKIAVTASDGSLRIFDLTRPRSKQICNIIAHDHHALCLCVSPDGTRIVTGGADWACSMWTAEDLELMYSDMVHTGYVRYLDWSSDATMIASCSTDMTVCLWSGEDFLPLSEPCLGHTSWVRWCQFTKDCMRLLTGSDDQTVMVWEVPSGQVLQTLRAHSHTVAGGCLMANNKLFTAGYDENVLLWTQDTGLLGYLKVFVIEAFDLKRGDGITGSMSNQRFVSLELGKGQKEQTTNKKGSAPHWYEEFNLSVWDLSESVVVNVFDWDKDENHRFLGEVRIPLEDLAYAEEGVTDKEFDLDDGEDAGVKPSISLRFTFREVECIGEVTVLVEKAKGLPRMDTFGLSDPFCAVSVGKSERHKTKVVRRNLNPVWNEEFVYNVEEGARELKIVLYDWSVTKEEDFIGQVIFSVEMLQGQPFLDDWFKLKSIDGASDVKGEVKLTIKFLSEAERDKGMSSRRFRRNPTTWSASVRSDFNYFAPIGQVVLLGRTIMRGRCRYCSKHRLNHTNNLRCDLGKGNYVHCIDVSTDGVLVAWGTGDGRIRVGLVATGEQLACWTAHAGPVVGIQWSKGDLRLCSYGADYRQANTASFVRGSFIPDESQREPFVNVVEIWFVGSMVKAVAMRKKRNVSGAEKDEEDDENEAKPVKGEEGDAASDEESPGNSDDDDGDEASEKKKMDKAVGEGAKLKKRSRKNKLQGKVGYTPVYYDPPTKLDGTLARSCLKGRGEKRAKKMNFVWGEIPDQESWFYYPPEFPEEEEEEEERPARRRTKPKVSKEDTI